MYTQSQTVRTFKRIQRIIERIPKYHKDVFFKEFEGIKYPCREIKLGGQFSIICVQSLNDILYDNETGEYKNKEAERVDNDIIFFIEDDKINLPTQELTKEVGEEIGFN